MDVVDRVFGLSPAALSIRSQRFELITGNLANADTPGYKAVDIDFAKALANAQEESLSSATPDRRHLELGDSGSQPLYRMPSQPSLDGNTVETEQEHAAFMDNAIRYQASLNFLNGRIQSMMLALRGE